MHPIDEDGLGHGLQLQLDYDGSSFTRVANAENLWGQDPQRLEAGHWTGMRNVLYEDFAIAESQGEIADRSYETVGHSDEGIMRARRVFGFSSTCAFDSAIEEALLQETACECKCAMCQAVRFWWLCLGLHRLHELRCT